MRQRTTVPVPPLSSQSDLPPTLVLCVFVISSEIVRAEGAVLASLLAVASRCVRLTSITKSRWRSPLCPGELGDVFGKLAFRECEIFIFIFFNHY